MTARRTTLKVASLNTWHGLNGRGRLYFGLLEARAERMARLARQVNAFKALAADVILLQEVNPLPFRAHWYARQLHKRVEYVTCNAGVKLGWGPPYNLNEGLAILYPQEWEAEYLGKKRLSGQFRMRPLRLSQVGGPYLSLQLHESRVAMAVRLQLPQYRQHHNPTGITSVLLGVTHLHHAPALTPGNETLLEEAEGRGLTPEEKQHVLRSFRYANARRVSELDTLATWLEGLRRPGEPIVLGGDFNCEPDSAPIRTLERHGWGDLWRMRGLPEHPSLAATWDPTRNPLAWRTQDFHQVGSDYSVAVHDLLKRTDALPRRIDYLFAYPASQADVLDAETDLGCLGRILSMSRFGYLQGNPLTHEGLRVDIEPKIETRAENAFAPDDFMRYVSDHFGVFAEFGLGE